jgi:hypothetical protein
MNPYRNRRVSFSPSKIPYCGFFPSTASDWNSTTTFIHRAELKRQTRIHLLKMDLYEAKVPVSKESFLNPSDPPSLTIHRKMTLQNGSFL